MNISELFIRRPVATILLAVALTAAGLFGYRALPVAALPTVDFPTIVVTAQLPGAAPDTMTSSIATPLIKQFSTVPAIATISSSSTQGQTQITIEFDLDRNIDQAAADVQAAIARTLRQLPPEMTNPPSYRKVNPADAPILLLALQSGTKSLSDLDAFAQQVISPALSTISGVGQVQVYGSQKYAVRIEVDPAALAARGIGLNTLADAVTAANANTPLGTITNKDQTITIQARTQMNNAAAFANLIVSTQDGRSVRLGDVARVIDSVENVYSQSNYDGRRSIVLAVQRQSDANTVAVVDAVKAMLPNLLEEAGKGTTISVLNDRSVSIRSAVEDVQFTLVITIGLVVMVILLFLRKLVATMIPAIAVPISIIATCAAMYALGLSIDNISLLALTLSVGLVVDDAIVMLENIVRHIEEGMQPFEAALKGAREIGFTIISITLSLVAVFIPVLLMGGVVGRIFNEFALVVSISILASSVVSLTLTPMLCARLPASVAHHDKPGWFDRFFDGVTTLYRIGLDFCLKAKPLVLLLFLGTIWATVHLVSVIPKGFFPTEDLGQLSISTEARQDISFDRMVELQRQVQDVLLGRPYVTHVASVVGSGGGGGGTANTGRFFVELKDKSERGELSAVLADLRRELGRIPGISSYAVPVQNLRLGGRQSRAEFQFVLRGLNRDQLYDWSQKIADAMGRDRAHFVDVNSDLQANALQATVDVDQDKANRLGISASTLRSTLYSAFGNRQISTIFGASDSYNVVMEFDPQSSWTPDRLDQLKVRSTSGVLVPLSAFATVKRTAGLLSINQLGQLPAVTISFNLPAGRSLGEAVAQIDRIKADLNVPNTILSGFAGNAKVFQDALGNQGVLIGAAVLTIYIILGMLYESFIHPLTILTGLPAAAAGALIALDLYGMDLSVIAVIGILMLIGIVKKNAIMMIDFALEKQRSGTPSQEAIREACLVRFRPIMMTTLAALMGTLPIAIGAGASSELRQPLGIAVVGGLIVSQVLTLFITPVIFLYMEALSGFMLRLWNGRGARKDRHADHARDGRGEAAEVPAE